MVKNLLQGSTVGSTIEDPFQKTILQIQGKESVASLLPVVSLFPIKKSRLHFETNLSMTWLLITEQHNLTPVDKMNWMNPKASTVKNGRKNSMQDLGKN